MFNKEFVKYVLVSLQLAVQSALHSIRSDTYNKQKYLFVNAKSINYLTQNLTGWPVSQGSLQSTIGLLNN